ncbi:MAG TPA: caspase family protein [Bryobacteraceae bacterium]|jgi:hypothetical protein
MKTFAALCLLLGTATVAAAQCTPVRRAVVVGINTYTGNRKPAIRAGTALVARLPVAGSFQPREFWNLEGAVNDATRFAAVLQGDPYSFEEQNIKLLTEDQATAQNILDTFERQLIDASQCPGDISLFYYSGHGSQIRNTAVKDLSSPDAFDETIVPYDAAGGAPDIRSKELVRLYLKAARKGVILTAIFDSCQSGGLTRGAMDFSRPKYGLADSRTVNDPGERDASGNLILPTRRSRDMPNPVLVLSAAYEKEAANESGGRGLFTTKLLDTFTTHPPREAIGTLFEDAKLAVSLEHNDQHPQISGEGRLERDLLDQPADATTGMVARVLRIQPDGTLVIDKGTAAGIFEGSELVSTSKESPEVRITISQARLADAIATPGPGGTTVQPGWRFRLDRWAVPKPNSLTVYFEKNGPTADELAHVSAMIAQAGVEIVSDPTVATPTHQIWWLDGQWQLLSGSSTKGKPLGKTLNAAAIPKGARLFLNYPLPSAQAAKLALGEGTANSAVSVQKSPNAPKYILAGRWNGSAFEYAWLRPGVTEADQKGLSLPVRTDWISASDPGFEAKLQASALQLNRIYGWLTLTSRDSYPYRLELRKPGSPTPLSPGRDHTTAGETYKLWLTSATRPDTVEPRWIYVLVIDRDGNVGVLFPSTGSNTGNRIPMNDSTKDPGAPPASIELTSQQSDLTIQPPYGLDTYILLTSKDPLDPQLFPAEGVRSDSATRGGNDPLATLLGNIGNTRGGTPRAAIPTTWSVQTLTIPSLSK